MKRIFLKMAIVLIATITVNAVYAQEKGDMAVGGNLVLGVGDSYTNFGIGGKFQYNILTPLRLEGSLSYFFKKDMVQMWDMSANAHYLFPVADKIKVYPLGGLSILGVKTSVPTVSAGGITISGGTVSNTYLGVNVGGGVDYKFSEKIILNAELKYRIGDMNRFLVSIGMAYKL